MRCSLYAILPVLAVLIVGCGKDPDSVTSKQPESANSHEIRPDGGDNAPAPRQRDAKYREVMSLPEGIEVIHTPNPVRAQRNGPSEAKYTYVYRTEVRTKSKRLRLVEFGAFVQPQPGKWVFSTFTGKPFTASDFAEWYNCPGAYLEPGNAYADESNWSGANKLRNTETIWYYIGEDKDGNRYQGSAHVWELDVLKLEIE